MTVCDEVRLISKFIQNWLLKQSAVKEESLTDWLLFQMSEKVKQVTYLSFTRIEEARVTGADWEWWFLFHNGISYKMRVQAKKIFDDNYSSLAYSNCYGFQIKKLLEDALKTNSIPLYAFYTSKSGTVMCKQKINDEGVFIAGANNIYNIYNNFIINGRIKIKPEDILKITNAISCFFCCPMSIGNLYDFFKNYYPSENQVDIARNLGIKNYEDTNNTLGLHKSLPNYIIHALKGEQAYEYFEKEFKNQITDINAILICDFREYTDINNNI